MLLMHTLLFFSPPLFYHKVLYTQWMKLVSAEKAAVSRMKHGSLLIMHSSGTEHFRTGGEGDGTWLQI